jgi:hypothetical protein
LTVVAFYPHGAAVCLCIYFRVRGKGRRKLSDCLETRLCLCSFLISTPNLHTTDRLWILFQVWVLLELWEQQMSCEWSFGDGKTGSGSIEIVLGLSVVIRTTGTVNNDSQWHKGKTTHGQECSS